MTNVKVLYVYDARHDVPAYAKDPPLFQAIRDFPDYNPKDRGGNEV